MSRYICLQDNQYDGKKVYSKDGLYTLSGTPPSAFFTATTLDVTRPRNIVGYTDLDGTYYYGKGVLGWDDLRFPAAGVNPPGLVSDPGIDNIDGTLLFDAASTEIIMGQVQMPHAWLEGSDIHPHIHWGPTSTGGGNVVWKFDYDIANINDAFAGSFDTESITKAAGIVDDQHLLSSFTQVAMPDKTFSCMIKWRLSRVGGDAADTYGADAKLYELDFHYQINSLGSGQEYAK